MPRRRNTAVSKKYDDKRRRQEAEISILPHPDKEYCCRFAFNDRYIDVIDCYYSNTRSAISDWIQTVRCSHSRKHRRSSSTPPILIGVRIFRARWSRLGCKIPRSQEDAEQGKRRKSARRSCKIPRSQKVMEQEQRWPISTLVLCSGASELCLVVHLDYHYTCDYNKKATVEYSLREFLMDKNVRFVGIGMEKAAEWILSAIGLDLKEPVELQTLVERAFGVGRPDSVFSLFGYRENVEIEEMAEIVMDGVSIKKAPQKMEKVMPVYGLDEDELLTFAVRDAFLACEIGERCFDRIKGTK